MHSKIFLTDLSAYNQGHLVGRWIDLPCDNLQEQLKEILAEGEEICNRSNELGINNYTSTHEEYFITDSEADFEIHEYSNLDKINEIAEQHEDLDGQDQKKINYLMDNNGCTFEEALEKYEDVELYEDTTLEDLAYELVHEGCFGEIPDSVLAQYIDYTAIAHDLQYDYTAMEGDIYRCD